MPLPLEQEKINPDINDFEHPLRTGENIEETLEKASERLEKAREHGILKPIEAKDINKFEIEKQPVPTNEIFGDRSLSTIKTELIEELKKSATPGSDPGIDKKIEEIAEKLVISDIDDDDIGPQIYSIAKEADKQVPIYSWLLQELKSKTAEARNRHSRR
jgi:hypothetical protein